MRDRLFIVTMLLPTLVLLVLFYGYPIFDNLRISFTDLSLLGMRKGGNWVGLDNYRELFQSSEFGHILFNTFIWLTATSVILRLLIGLAIAVLLNTRALKRLRLASISRFALLIPWATPPIVAVVIWRFLLERNGAVNEALISLGLIDQPIAFFADMRTVWPSIVLIMLWNTVPLIALSLLSSLQTVPDELYESSRIDGANVFHRFYFVTLPWLSHALLLVLITQTMVALRTFDIIYVLTGGGPGDATTVLAWLAYVTTFSYTDFGKGNAYAYTIAIITLVLSIVYIRVLWKRGEMAK